MALRENPIQAPRDAWPMENRRAMMRDTVAAMARHGDLHRINPQQYAGTYGVKPCEVEAEMMKYLQEGEGK